MRPAGLEESPKVSSSAEREAIPGRVINWFLPGTAYVRYYCNMAERPKWFRGVTTGGKADVTTENNKKKSDSPPESVQEPAINPSPDKSAEPDSIFTLKGGSGGWESVDTGERVEDSSEINKESALVRLYLELSRKPPANFEASVRRANVQEVAPTLRSWSVDAMHTYLARADIWKRPSYTKAVFQEINERMRLGSLAARE